MKPIRVTKHAIEEYLEDNPKSNTPEVELKLLFHKLRRFEFRRKLEYYSNKVEQKVISKFNHTIVYSEGEDEFVLITYYKYLPDFIPKTQRKYKTKFKNIMNGKLEQQKENKRIRKENRERNKFRVGKFQKITKGSLRARFR